jgi:pyrroline-5-carboxylate reductase
MQSIGLIGFGIMGEAIAEGLRSQDPETELGVIEKKQDRQERAAEQFQARVFSSYGELFDFADITIVAIKPQDMHQLFSEAAGAAKGRQVISIAAGVAIATIQAGLHTDQVVRFMPNMAAQIRKSVIGVSSSDAVSDTFRTQALEIAAVLGTPYELPENLLRAITGLSGSGIAFVLAFVHALALGGTKQGIPYPTSLQIARDTVEGAAELLKRSDKDPMTLLHGVISPAGTTIEGVYALEENSFTAAVMEAVEAAAERAEEIEKLSSEET